MMQLSLFQLPLLSSIIWISIIGGFILLLFTRSGSAKFVKLAQGIALTISLLCLALCGGLLSHFNPELWEMQFTETAKWIEPLGIYYSLGVDGFSVPLIVLSCLMTTLVVLASIKSVKERIPEYLSAFLIMQGLICGALSALNAILFYVFWEAMLVPMFIIIGVWGGTNRLYAAIKFFLYTFLGSVLFLVALIFLYVKAQSSGMNLEQSFQILTFQKLPLTLKVQQGLFLAFVIAFAVKIPMWPVHTWLPDAHVEAPAGGSVILAAILLKMGGYGFLRFVLPIVPDAALLYAKPMILLSLVAIVYVGILSIVQKDMKKLVAYSSIAHMGFVTLGLFIIFLAGNLSNDPAEMAMSINGSFVQMISHGFISGALFLCVGVLYDRLHTRLIKDYGGVVNSMPWFATLFMIFAMANVGLPGTSGFVGEWFIILSTFKVNALYAILSASTLIWGACYTLWMYKRVMLGPVQNPAIETFKSLMWTEKTVLGLLAILVIGLGLWPEPLLQFIQASSEHLVQQAMTSKLP